MATDGTLVSVYRSRIGEPTIDDEAYGYWLFVVGIILGIVGLLLFYVTASRSTPRQFGYLLGAIGLILLFAGPTIRLPLTRRGLILTYLGAVVGVVAMVWFTMFYPSNWTGPEGNPAVTLYIVGLGLMAVGAVVSPLLTGRKEAHDEAVRTAQEATELAQQASQDTQQQTQIAEQASRERDTLAEGLATSEAAREELETVTAATEAELAAAQATIAAAMDSKATFELYEDAAGKYRWRLRHRNSNVIADSAQGYASRQKAMQGLRSVQSNAAGGAVVFFEDATEDVPVVPAPESDAAFELFEDSAGGFRWRLRHDNGNILADSGEGYSSRSNARRAARRVSELAPDAAVDDGFEVYEDAGEEWRWRLRHRNGEIIADSGEGHAERNKAVAAIERIRRHAPGAPDEE
jgi:uncharacterized protein YegP (UPF0339 family)